MTHAHARVRALRSELGELRSQPPAVSRPLASPAFVGLRTQQQSQLLRLHLYRFLGPPQFHGNVESGPVIPRKPHQFRRLLRRPMRAGIVGLWLHVFGNEPIGRSATPGRHPRFRVQAATTRDFAQFPRSPGNRLKNGPALEDDCPGLVHQFRAMRFLIADCSDGQLSGLVQGCIHQFSAGELAAAVQVEPICHSAGLAVSSASPGTPKLRPDEVSAGRTGCSDPTESCCRCRSPGGAGGGGGECCCARKPWQSFRA